MKTIALANQKGGVGKTTTAASLGVGLAQQGKKVLLVDADAQGNLTQMLGWRQPDELSPTLADLMTKTVNEEPIAPGEGILHHASGVDLVPANIELSGLEVTLVNIMSRETVLRQYLSTVAPAYDYAIIDCMPSLGMLTINALTAADSVMMLHWRNWKTALQHQVLWSRKSPQMNCQSRLTVSLPHWTKIAKCCLCVAIGIRTVFQTLQRGFISAIAMYLFGFHAYGIN